MFVSSPIAMEFTSPRMVAFGQTLERSPMVTFPITCALPSTYAEAAIWGTMPR